MSKDEAMETVKQFQGYIQELVTALADCIVAQNAKSYEERQCTANRGRMLIEKIIKDLDMDLGIKD